MSFTLSGLLDEMLGGLQAGKVDGVSDQFSQDLIFSIGPVHDFIGQARRLRDYWAGSFLLSWLSGNAIAALTVELGRQKVENPLATAFSAPATAADPMLAKMLGADFAAWGGLEELIEAPFEFEATLPEKFHVRLPKNFESEAGQLAGDLCEDAVRGAWRKLAAAVFNEFIQPLEQPSTDGESWPLKRVREIWDAQIDAFWEPRWVEQPANLSILDNKAPDLSSALAARKLHRDFDHTLDVGPGAMCRLMGGWREISGFYVDPAAAATSPWAKATRQEAREARRGFWRALAERTAGFRGPSLDLRGDEALCAIAIVKRLFPLLPPSVVKEVFGWLPPLTEQELAMERGDAGRKQEEGRLLVRYWASTASIAATSWVERVETAAGTSNSVRKVVESFVRAVKSYEGASSVSRRNCRGRLSKAERYNRLLGLPGKSKERSFAQLDGKLFHSDAYERADLLLGKDECQAASDAQQQAERKWRAETKLALLALAKATSAESEVSYPSKYYAVLRMDGDKMGDLLKCAAEKGLDREFSTRLAEFSLRVGRVDQADQSSVIRRHRGDVVFRGGDDLLAVLPIEYALPAAIAVRETFVDVMEPFCQKLRAKGAGPEAQSHISAGIVFAPFNRSLGWVMREAQTTLEDFAKGQCGRDSCAIRVFAGDGQMLEWAVRWKDPPGDRRIGGSDIYTVQEALALALQIDDGVLGRNTFIYRALERLEPFSENEIENQQHYKMHIETMLRAAAAEGGLSEAAVDCAGQLSALLLPSWAELNIGADIYSRRQGLCIDGLLLLRFLNEEWRGSRAQVGLDQ